MEIIKNRKNILNPNYIYYVGIVVFFLCFAVFGPIGIYDDTPTYQALSSDRDPFYALFLQIFRVFGENLWLRSVVIFQNLLMAYAGISVLRFFEQQYKLNHIWKILIVGCLLAPHLLIPIATTSGMILCNSVLSEGICIPVYLLFFVQLLKAMFEKENFKRAMLHGVLAFVYALILCMARGQLLAVLVAWVLVMGGICIVRKNKKVILLVCVMFVAGFGIKSVVNGLYNLGANGVYTGNTSESATMLAHAFFNMDLNKEITFDDPKLQEVYEEIRGILIEEELNYAYAPKGLSDFILYYEYCHDEIKFNRMVVPIHMLARENGAAVGVETSIRCNEISKELCTKLYLQNPTALFQTYVKLALAGFVRTISYLHPLFMVYSVLMYAVVAALTIRMLLKAKKKQITEYSSAVIMVTVLLLSAGLVFSTALVTACISRYVIYNMSIFYVAVLMLLRESVMH